MELSLEQSTEFDKLLREITRNEHRNSLRFNYHEGEQRFHDLGPTIPPTMLSLATVIGWPKKAVTVRASRLHPRGFRMAEASQLFERVKPAMEMGRFARKDEEAKQLAIQYGCAFMFTSRLDRDRVTYTVKSPRQATAALDPRTGEVLVALERVAFGDYLLYTPGGTARVERSSLGGWRIHEFNPGVNRTTCTVYTHDATTEKPFGQSAITRPVMGLTDSAVRTLLRQEVSAEFYSSPQRYLLGADEDMFLDANGEPRPGWEIILGSLLVAPPVEDEETGEKSVPTAGQFPQMSMQPHSDQLRTIAMMFSGETSIPPSYLGIIHDNPASASAILANEADLISSTEDRQPEFAESRRGVAMDTAAVLYGDWTPAMEAELATLTTNWRDAATPNQQSIAQAVTGLVGAGVLPAQSRVTWEMLGLDEAVIERLEADVRRSTTTQLLQRMADNRAAATPGAEAPTSADVLAPPAADPTEEA